MTFTTPTHDRDLALREDILRTAIRMNAAGINQGKSGNVSARTAVGFLITPTGIPYEDTRREDIVPMALDGTHTGPVRPSSEWRFHRDLYVARPEVQAIVHTHAVHCTALAVHGRGIPAFHYMVAIAGGADIRCAPYATFGTQELSDHALAALEDRKACLLAHHGMIAVGRDLDQALAIAVEVEVLARTYLAALAVAEPPLLPADEMARVIEKFATYGQQAEAEAGAEA
ncbi:MAG: L-fuculose-phosphate aldolase [Betaproteobacteria bacterium]|nr:L-fuculose-phosphate aldolase [Betaproteobacteria bacterium]